MTDDDLFDSPPQGPMPSSEWMAARARWAVEKAEAADRLREQQSLAETIEAYDAIAQRMIARFSSLPCEGAVAKRASCNDGYAVSCDERESPSCPRQIVAFEQQRTEEERRKRLAESGVAEEVIALLESNLHPTEATQAVDTFLAASGKLLVLSGKPGVGKSIAAGYAIWRAQRGRFCTASELARLSAFDDEDKLRLKALQTTRFLVIDDLGTEFADGKGWATSVVDGLVTQRFDANRPTVITTNLDAKGFIARYGPRVGDRLVGSKGFVNLAGKSQRWG